MSEVPSSAIIAVLSTIAAAILFGVLFSAYQGTTQLAMSSQNTEASMQTEQLLDDYDQYNGSAFTGSEVRNFLSIYRNADEAFVVLSDDGREIYNSLTANFSTDYANTGHYEIDGVVNSNYISPTATYICSFEFSSNGSISRVVFTPE